MIGRKKVQRTRIKICGIRKIEDALFTARCGADAIGLNFYEPSPRSIALADAIAIKAALPSFIATVALFVNPERSRVDEIIARLKPCALQFHGDEDAHFCESFNMPYLKAMRIGAEMTSDDLLQYRLKFQTAQALLLDKLDAVHYGGTGETFDWRIIPNEMREHIVLAGGLTSANAVSAIQTVRPWAVDVSSGVESFKAIKDYAKIASFIKQVRLADQDETQ